MPERTRVLVLTKSLAYGGAEGLIVAMAEVRDRARFDYEVAYVLASAGGRAKELVDSGIAVHCLGATSNYGVAWMWRLRKLLVEGRFDVMHMHLPYAAACGRLVALSLGRSRCPQLVYTEHTPWYSHARLTRALGRLTCGRDQAVIAVSREALEALPRPARRRAEVVTHGIALEEVRRSAGPRSEVRDELGVGDDEVLAVTIANLREQKGYDILLKAASRLVGEGLGIRFVAVGFGPEEKALEALHRRLELGAAFRFLGLRPDATRLLGGADLFVLSSLWEGMPVALMEAMAVGLPVVATSVGAIPAAVTDGVEGLLVEPGSAELMADAIRKLATDGAARARMGAAALESSARFDVKVATSRAEAIYLALCAPT